MPFRRIREHTKKNMKWCWNVRLELEWWWDPKEFLKFNDDEDNSKRVSIQNTWRIQAPPNQKCNAHKHKPLHRRSVCKRDQWEHDSAQNVMDGKRIPRWRRYWSKCEQKWPSRTSSETETTRSACVCVCACVRACVCVCVDVCERERAREETHTWEQILIHQHDDDGEEEKVKTGKRERERERERETPPSSSPFF